MPRVKLQAGKKNQDNSPDLAVGDGRSAISASPAFDVRRGHSERLDSPHHYSSQMPGFLSLEFFISIHS